MQKLFRAMGCAFALVLVIAFALAAAVGMGYAIMAFVTALPWWCSLGALAIVFIVLTLLLHYKFNNIKHHETRSY